MPDSPARWPRIRAVFEHAFELDDAERDAFLAQECAGDSALEAEVRSLLQANVDAADALEPPDRERLGTFLERQLGILDHVESHIGGYHIRRTIASGGMGVVFEAEQDNPRRRVALKMMRLGFDKPEAARRFRYEAEILAMLRHPGIAQVYEAGVHRPSDQATELPWFAMEFVEDARTLLDYADRQELSIEHRLTLFVEACEAVQHGHQRGVVHRDLKPDNILVDGSGRPKIIDFGVACTTDADLGLSTMRTQAGVIAGTVRYMSPEQIRGQRDLIDTRSDVYTLGVVLCELLTGALPYDLEGLDIHAAAAKICDAPPRPPSRGCAGLTGDLDVIAQTALQKERDRRYASAGALADDIARYLRGEPITARPPSLGYQLRLFGRRHRLLVGGALVMLALVLVAAVISANAAFEADAARSRGEEVFRRFVQRSLESTFDFAVRIHGLPGAAPISSEMIQRTVADLQMLEKQAEVDRDLRLDLARAYGRLGEVRGLDSSQNIADVEGAGESLGRARDIAAVLVDEAPDDQDRRQVLAQSLRRLGQWHEQIGQREDARALLRQSTEVIDELHAAAPRDRALRLEAGRAHEMLSRTLYGLDELDAADVQATRAQEIFAALHAEDPDDESAARRFVTARNALVNSYYRRGLRAEKERRPDEAHSWYERSMREASGIASELEQRSGTPSTQARIWIAGSTRWASSMALLLDRLDQAEEGLARALTIYRGFTREDPEDPRWAPLIGDLTTSLGNVARSRAERADDPERQRAHWQSARAWYAESLEIWEALEKAGSLAGPRRAIPANVRDRLESCDRELARR